MRSPWRSALLIGLASLAFTGTATAGVVGLPAWDVVASPNSGTQANVLEDVDGTGSSDVWAVGHESSITFVGSKTLILRWNGSSWRRIASPSPGSGSDQSFLTGVAAISPSDAWAVGAFRTNDPADARALTFHWNGTAWIRVPNNCGASLREVFALSATNVWAVGGGSTCRWDGSTWRRISAAPPITQGYLDLQDVTGTGPNNLWAVGLVSSS